MTPPGGRARALLAVDVAVLLPEPLLQPVLRLNAELLPPPDGFRFDDTHLPHVTLAQLFVAEVQLPAVVHETAAALRGATPLRLAPTGLSRGRTASTVRLEPTGALISLHARLMDRLQQFECDEEGDATAFLSTGGLPARDADVDWVLRFRADAAYDRFDPHVTVGVGALHEPGPLPAADGARVALCQLGRFCTCRRILAEWTLTPREP